MITQLYIEEVRDDVSLPAAGRSYLCFRQKDNYVTLRGCSIHSQMSLLGLFNHPEIIDAESSSISVLLLDITDFYLF